jgi:octaprenyl-diphosphate synthase
MRPKHVVQLEALQSPARNFNRFSNIELRPDAAMNPNPIQTPAEPDVVKRITDYLAVELDEVGAILRRSLDTESEIIREVGEYLAITPGKKLRPMLTLLTARALAPEKSAPVEVAAALEFVHVATLLHDDVIDKAETRRGRPSVNAQWGDDVAILMADFLYAGAFDLALRSLKPEVIRLICQVSQRMCEGEMLQIKLRNRTYTTSEYIEVVGRKTASLFSACTSLGALFAERSVESVAAASSFGHDFGIAFQITDDVLDFTADPAQLGQGDRHGRFGGQADVTRPSGA